MKQLGVLVIGLKRFNVKEKIIWKFLGAYILLILIAVFVLSFFVGLKLQDYYEAKIADRLESDAFLVGNILTQDLINNDQNSIQRQIEYLSDKLESRITVISLDGEVLGDSSENPDSMGNHKDRLEVVRAIEFGVGESNRFSDTLGYNMKYVAVPVKKNDNMLGTVRVALPLEEVVVQLRFIYRIVLIGAIVTIFFALIIGYVASRRITSPISEMKEIAQNLAEGNFSKRASVKSQDELGELARALNKMADELQEKISNLKKLDQIRTDFIANVSHELKTPLTSIRGFIETLEDGALADKKTAERFISIIKKHAQGLSNIVDDLLNLSELESKRNEINVTKLDLKQLLEEVVLGFGHATSVKNHKLELESKGEDFSIRADRSKIEQVFVNIIDNAIKYTDQGGLIKINLLDENDNLKVVVKDNGVGIPKECLDRIFERFFRVDKARSRQLGGTGLGLAIVKHIISLHKGKIQIENALDKGTEVTIFLPKA